VIWGDPLLERVRLQHAPRESLKNYPRWPAAAVGNMLRPRMPIRTARTIPTCSQDRSCARWRCLTPIENKASRS
jgi:hypothetical protein